MNEDFRKTTEIEKGKGKIIYIRNKGYTLFRGIIYGVLNDEGDLIKTISFNMWDDFSFSADTLDYEEYKKDNLKFKIEKENPLYKPLKDFLGEDKEFLLDDDTTKKINQKTMKIEDVENRILITFSNIKEEKELLEDSEEKFKVFIKNIMYDGRSKLDQSIYEEKNDVKKRLMNLICDMECAIAGKEELEDIIMKNEIYYLDENMLFTIIPELKDCKRI